ncbi:heterokaryon incompatibility protein-domain-containing protein [Exophiala viscosa]|uniref:Heterokaryon incompatibility protein-domain-containing protein n=1 Tax=Exophiala viscosa TaxID=2486360 RepID=A0AAN6E5C8_9EURO|nr:heterokaryon incompatibility protein-domain-containing protein [Exophiala viscosa]
MLWVDALCINQNDSAEKSEQIPLMKEIYKHALRVIVWLGPSSEATETAFEIAEVLAVLWACRTAVGMNVNERFDVHDRSVLDNAEVFDISKDGIWTLTDSLPHERLSKTCQRLRRLGLHGSRAFDLDNQTGWAAYEDLLDNSIFPRAWIVKELAVAQVAQVHSGTFTLPWDVFCYAFKARKLLSFQKWCSSKDGANAYAISNVERTDLAMIMGHFEYSKATDPRDYIYAALGLVKSNGSLGPNAGVVPDYDKQVEEVYLEAATHMIAESRSLFLWERNVHTSRKVFRNLPTWVPDWSVSMLTVPPKINPWYCYFPGQHTVVGRRLFVNAHLLDEICFIISVENMQDFPGPMTEVIRLFENVGWGPFDAYRGQPFQASVSSPQDSSITHEQPLHNHFLNLKALWCALTCSGFNFIESVPPTLPLFLAWWYDESWHRIHQSKTCPHNLSRQYLDWEQAAGLLADSRVFDHYPEIRWGEDLFFTKSGYFGRSDKGVAKQGHQVAVLGGALHPAIIT